MPRPGRFTPGKDLVPICVGGSVGPRACLDRREKSRPPPGFDPRTIQPIASHYTDYSGPPKAGPLSLLCGTGTMGKM